ncbi:MAG: heme biosynthesis HemY N-terminal domain-containing protein [Clostridiales bacterium]|nr:heme biosynthesis HemY N-terminal domain-containing protein [Clostridiales bacterium]
MTNKFYIYYNFTVSNLTDGKKALAAGDFATAEKKLIKALDHRPDDGELWWSLMLCKCGFKSDEELETAVKAKYESADADAPPPPTPFDTSYCKNALKYGASPKHKDFVERVSAELSDIRQAKGGKALKAPKTNIKTYSKRDYIGIATYASTGVAAVGSALAAYALFEHATWALWTGFALLIFFALAAFILRSFFVKSGGSAKAADISLVALFAATGVVILVAGIVIGSKSVIILAVAVMLLAALIGGYRFLGGRKTKPTGTAKKGARGKSGKAAYDRSNVVAATNDNKKKSAKKGGDHVYKDEDD